MFVLKIITILLVTQRCLVAESLESSLDKNIDRDAGSDLVEALGKLINNILGNLSNNGVDNEVLYCVWNDWESRDQRAHIEKTFKNCRFSQVYRTWGFPNGRMYCTYKQSACAALGNALD